MEMALPGWFDRRDPTDHSWPGLRSMAAVVARLAEIDAVVTAATTTAAAAQARAAPPDPLIAWGFDPIYFGGERMTVAHLDLVGDGTRPIVIAHANGHLMNVNSAMLHAAGISAETEVEGVMTFEAGPRAVEPNGELQEPAAMYLVLKTSATPACWRR